MKKKLFNTWFAKVILFHYILFINISILLSDNVIIKTSQSFKQFLFISNNSDNIFLLPKIYKGNFYIRNSVNIFNNQKSIIYGNNKNDIFYLSSINSIIYGLNLKNSGQDISKKNSCIFVNKNGSHSFVINNFFTKCNFGIWLDQSNNNLIKKNIIVGKLNNIVSNRGNNIQIFKNNSTIINYNYIIYGRDGVYISNSNNIIIKKNVFIMNRFGIHYMYSNNSFVENNIILKSSVGAALMYSKLLNIIKNVILNNKNHGILFRDILYSKIIKNKIILNMEGFFLGSSYYNYIIHNIYFRNNIASKISNGSNGNLVYNNNFVENKMQIYFLDNKFIYWHSENIGNFWSNYTGWGIKLEGICNKKFYITNISDWLVFNYPVLNIILNTPIMLGLKKFEGQFPSFRKESVIDKHPLIQILK